MRLIVNDTLGAHFNKTTHEILMFSLKVMHLKISPENLRRTVETSMHNKCRGTPRKINPKPVSYCPLYRVTLVHPMNYVMLLLLRLDIRQLYPYASILLSIIKMIASVFPAQRPVTRNFDVFFDLSLNKRLSKQS